MNDQNGRYARLRHFATGAVAALAVVGAIAGTAALAAKPGAKDGHTTLTNVSTTKTPTPAVPGKTHTSQPGSDQPFLTAVQRLVDDGTISTTEGRVLDGEIVAGTVDTATLASNGFTPTQLQAVQQTLANAKLALAAAAPPAEPSQAPSKSPAPRDDARNPFVVAVRRLVNDGTISNTEGQAVDREILAGRVDTDTLASSGFTPTQLQAVQQALTNIKRGL